MAGKGEISVLSGNRRNFLKATGTAFAALATSCTSNGMGAATKPLVPGYGPLKPDPAGLLDLPRGFSYTVVSSLGDAMDDGFTVPDFADGMGCFALDDGTIALVRNHELLPGQDAGGNLPSGYDRFEGSQTLPTGQVIEGSFVLPGGTTTMVLDPKSMKVLRQNRSLAGTMRNCAGGTTPWGSWLSCEEWTSRAGGPISRDHGYVFEVPATAQGLVDPVPLKAMGRFYHEAACVDPVSGIVYMTEDRVDGLLYRFIPAVRGSLNQGGRLQALALAEVDLADSRNWNGAFFDRGSWYAADWIDLDDVESPNEDLRYRGAAKGALLFGRGEGLFMGDGELYFCCTSGGAMRLGQVFCLRPKPGGPDMLQLFFESDSLEQFNFGDNLCVAPNGHLIVCEDQYAEVVDNHLRGITPAGEAYTFARLHWQTELAGACYSPDGKTLFVNVFSPTRTLAITGPWQE